MSSRQIEGYDPFSRATDYRPNHGIITVVKNLAGSHVVYTLSPRMFATALVQYSSDSNAMTANARFRWEYRPGSELFVVYNDERDTRARFPGACHPLRRCQDQPPVSCLNGPGCLDAPP